MHTDQLLAFITILIAVVPWAMSIHAKVALIASAMEGLPDLVRETRAKLDQHETAIKALQKAAVARH
jgi:hypothetical protein